MNTLTRPAIKFSSMRSIVTVDNVAHRFAAVRPKRFCLMFPHSRSLLIAAPQFQTTVVSKNIDPVRKFNGVSVSNVPVMRYSMTTSYYEERIQKLEEKISAKDQEIGVLQTQLNQVGGFVGAIVGRSAVEKIFVLKVKTFMPEKEPGKNYTGAEIQKGYIEFLKTNDPFATELKKTFPNLKNKQLARRIRKIYGRLSTLDHTLFDILKIVYTIEKLMEFICNIPAVLSAEDLKTVHAIVDVYLKTENDETSDSASDSEEDEETEL